MPMHKSKKWLENLSCALDNYYSMIQCKIIQNNDERIIDQLFTQTHFKSYLIASCTAFLSTCKALDSCKQINKLRCDTIIRFYRFIDIMLRSLSSIWTLNRNYCCNLSHISSNTRTAACDVNYLVF
eukprot:1023967_1